jgi:NADPH:quinone reductase-like Zn-dependent oxidoreductase
MVRSIGADHVVDYTREDFVERGESYDLILDMVGNRTLSDCRRALSPKGTLVLVGGTGGRWLGGIDRTLRAVLLSQFIRQRLVALISRENQSDLIALKDLVESGKLKPVIDRAYSLAAVSEAIEYLEIAHTRGKVVITVGG